MVWHRFTWCSISLQTDWIDQSPASEHYLNITSLRRLNEILRKQHCTKLSFALFRKVGFFWRRVSFRLGYGSTGDQEQSIMSTTILMLHLGTASQTQPQLQWRVSVSLVTMQLLLQPRCAAPWLDLLTSTLLVHMHPTKCKPFTS